MRRNSLINHDSQRSISFKKFRGLNKLKKAALGYMVTNLTEKEIECLALLFEKQDKNCDGRLSLSSFEDALASSDDFHLDLQEKLSSLREDLSLTGNESIVWKDFLAAMADKSLLIKEEKIGMAFKYFRKNGNKGVRVSELLDLIGGEEAAREILDMNLLEDKTEITYEEFKTMMSESFTDGDDGVKENRNDISSVQNHVA